MNRITRAEMMARIVTVVSQRSTCGRLQVGALLVKENRVVCIGYNGAPAHKPHCEEHGCNLQEACTLSFHAERNCLYFAGYPEKKFYGHELWVTHSPCKDCAQLIIDSGVSTVWYLSKYRSDEGIQLLQQNNVVVKCYEGDI